MRTKINFLAILLVMINQNLFSQNLFDYLGQTTPTDSARIFAPGIISKSDTKEGALAISPNGDEVFFVRGEWPKTKIMHMVKSENVWSQPDIAQFSKDCWTTEPAFSSDGKYLYFSTSKGKSNISDYSLWRVKKIKEGWSQLVKMIDFPGDSIWEFHPSLTKDGLLCFCYWDAKKNSGDIYFSKCSSKGCSQPKSAGIPVDSKYSDVDPFIGNDGSYIIYASNRPGGLGGYDQYITFKNNDGTWTAPKNLGPKFNNEKDNSDMDISPDGKYIFYYLNGDIYWMKNTIPTVPF